MKPHTKTKAKYVEPTSLIIGAAVLGLLGCQDQGAPPQNGSQEEGAPSIERQQEQPSTNDQAPSLPQQQETQGSSGNGTPDEQTPEY